VNPTDGCGTSKPADAGPAATLRSNTSCPDVPVGRIRCVRVDDRLELVVRVIPAGHWLLELDEDFTYTVLWVSPNNVDPRDGDGAPLGDPPPGGWWDVRDVRGEGFGPDGDILGLERAVLKGCGYSVRYQFCFVEAFRGALAAAAIWLAELEDKFEPPPVLTGEPHPVNATYFTTPS
jgi:hypothetical protein